MKNRNDGGYSLALVLVVMAVLATIAVTLTTVVLRNIDNQSKYTQKMQAQYEAQGKLEKVLAELSQNQIIQLETPNSQATAIKNAIGTACADGVRLQVGENPFKIWKRDANGEKDFVVSLSNFNTEFSYDFSLIAKSNDRDVEVTYNMQLVGKIACSETIVPTGVAGNSTAHAYVYIVTSPELVHKSVDVSGIVEDEGGGT